MPTVHIVDDDEAIRTALSMLFRLENIPSKTYSSAEEFLEQHAQLKVGCLLLDVRMPGMNGLELLDTIKHQEISIPVIFITGQGNISQAVRSVKAGAVDFIEKPFDNSYLVRLVSDCLTESTRFYKLSQEKKYLEEKNSHLIKYDEDETEFNVGNEKNKAMAK